MSRSLSAYTYNGARIEQTAIEFRLLREKASKWIEERLEADSLKHYQTQLKAIGSLLDSAAEFLQEQVRALNKNQPTKKVYDDCRLFDERVRWLWRIWLYFKDKFDQRQDASLRSLLTAADQVVWSCYRQVFARAEAMALDVKQGPTPLPFIEIVYSPKALTSEMVPYELRPGGTEFLKNLIAKLPVPLISLPQSCVKNPWWLIFLGHEVGHEVQSALGLQTKMSAHLKQIVNELCGQGEHSDEDAQKWGNWANEIFADVFSVLVMGQWAAWAMVELEMQQADELLKRRTTYQSPLARFHFLACVVTKLGMDSATILEGMDIRALASENAEAHRDILISEKIAAVLLDDPLPGMNVTLKDLAAFRLNEFVAGETASEVNEWSADLLKDGAMSARNNLRAARLAMSATTAAWGSLLKGWSDQDSKQDSEPDEEADRLEREREEARRCERDHLAERAVNFIAASSDPSERAGVEELNYNAYGFELAQQLMSADREALLTE